MGKEQTIERMKLLVRQMARDWQNHSFRTDEYNEWIEKNFAEARELAALIAETPGIR